MLSSEMSHFIAYCKVSDFSEKSIETLTLRLKDLDRFMALREVYRVEDLSYIHLKEFVTRFGNNSVHVKKAKIWTLHQFFHFLHLNGRIRDNIALQIPYPKMEKTVPSFLTIDEFNRMLDYFYIGATDENGLRNLSIIMILGLTGLRVASVVGLNLEDVDLRSGVMWVNEKGGRKRPLIIPGILCRTLGRFMGLRNAHHGPLFLSKRRQRISEQAIRKILRESAHDLGIDKTIHAHLFRHTAATHLNKVAGTDITQHVLGHAWRKNTYKYTHLNPDIYAVYMSWHPYMAKEV